MQTIKIHASIDGEMMEPVMAKISVRDATEAHHALALVLRSLADRIESWPEPLFTTTTRH